jgi:hypothetical protein
MIKIIRSEVGNFTIELFKNGANKSLHWIFTPLRSVKTSEFSRWA